MRFTDQQLIDHLKISGIIKPDGRINGKLVEHWARHHPVLPDWWVAYIDRTSFLGLSARNDQRIHSLEHNITEIVKCKHCAQVSVKFTSRMQGYKPFCGHKCAQASPETQMRKEVTMIKKYGVKSAGLSPTIRAKQKATCMERYGSATPFQSTEIQQKVRDNTFEKYGVASTALLPDIKARQIATRQSRYGCDFLFQSTDLQSKIEASTRLENGGRTVSQRHISPEVMAKLENVDWMTNVYSNQTLSSTHIAMHLLHGEVTDTTVLRHLHLHGIPIRKDQFRSSAEITIADFVQSFVPCEVSNRSIISPYELDVVVPTKNIAIEYNGLYWHRESHVGKDKHLLKTQLCEKAGYVLFQILEPEWYYHRSATESLIKRALGASPNIYDVDHCIAYPISRRDADWFFTENSITGISNQSKYFYGVRVDRDLIAVLALGNIEENHTVKIDNFSYAIDAYVPGLLRHLLIAFSEQHSIVNVIHETDRRLPEQYVEESGFKLIYTTPPVGYYFSTASKTPFLCSPNKFTKANIAEFVPNFDGQKTLYENMLENKFDRFWDCGTSVYEWQPA